MEKVQFASLRKVFITFMEGIGVPKNNYSYWIDVTKLESTIKLVQEGLVVNPGVVRKVTNADHILKDMPVY